jgi:hypothetical protein
VRKPREYIAVSQPKGGATEEDRPVLIICVHKEDFEALEERLHIACETLEQYVGIAGIDCSGLTKHSAAAVALAKIRGEK